jgi:hypothetical protein
VIKPQHLREHLAAALPELRRDPDRLQVYLDEGQIVATGVPGLSFEYRYTLNVLITDYAGHPDAVIVPLLAWLAVHQPELLHNPGQRQAIRFEADLLDAGRVDLSIAMPLTERVGVHRRPEGGHRVEHYPEPIPEHLPPGEHWQLYLRDELVAEWTTT